MEEEEEEEELDLRLETRKCVQNNGACQLAFARLVRASWPQAVSGEEACDSPRL